MILRLFWLFRALLFVTLAGAAGCSGARGASETPASRPVGYSPEEAVLFDDVLAPAVFGFDPEGRNPARDPKLRERTRRADFVAAARVETVSRVGGIENRGAYEITLAPAAPSLIGDVGTAPIVLRVSSTSPSYAWVDGAGVKWVGSRLVVFGRRYRDGNATTLHFRCEPDTAEVRAAVERNAGLRALR